MVLHQMIGNRIFFLRVLFLLAPLFAGCGSVQVNPCYDGMPLKPYIQKFDYPVIVFNPPNKVRHSYESYCIYDNDPVNYPYWKVLDGNILITDSYVILAKWCREFNAANTPFSLMIIDRRSSFKEISRPCLNLCLNLSFLCAIPFPRPVRFQCQPEAYYSLNQGERLQTIGEFLSSPMRYYGVYGEEYVSLTTPLALMIPKYKEYRFRGMGATEEEDMASLAHDLYKDRFLEDSLAELHTAIGVDKPRLLPEETFEKLFYKAFVQRYDPAKAYVLQVNLTGEDLYRSSVYENGTVISIEGGSGLTVKAGHLYVVYRKRNDLPGNKTWTTHDIFDLGEISKLGPVIAAWFIESGANRGMCH
jgi:hypothetical protein